MNAHFRQFRHYILGSKKMQFTMLIILMVSLVSCSNDDDEASGIDFPLEGTSLSVTDISGTWNATLAEFEVVGAPSSFIELVGAGGSAVLSIQNNGRFTSTIAFPGEGAQTFSGQLGFSGSQLVLLDDIDEPGEEAFLNINLTSDGILLLSGILEFDFDGDGSFEDTNTNFIMEQ